MDVHASPRSNWPGSPCAAAQQCSRRRLSQQELSLRICGQFMFVVLLYVQTDQTVTHTSARPPLDDLHHGALHTSASCASVMML